MWFNHIGDEMERNLIEKYKDKIISIATSMSYKDKDDLFQAGCIGLIKAYKNYDESKSQEFFYYAKKYILGEMMIFLRENRNIKVSRDMYSLNKKINDAYNYLSQKFMHSPTIEELSEFLEINVEDLRIALSDYNTTSLDKTINDDENKDVSLYDMIPNIEHLNKDDLISLKDGINSLTERERKIINLRYLKDYTQAQTANILGMSQVQVSRQEVKVLKKLNQEIA